jgi:hypothetical protein
MKMRCAGLVVVLVSLFAIGIGNPVMFNGGVIDPRITVTRIDSAKLTFRLYEDMTFLTPGWGTHPPLDTFVFAGVPPRLAGKHQAVRDRHELSRQHIDPKPEARYLVRYRYGHSPARGGVRRVRRRRGI